MRTHTGLVCLLLLSSLVWGGLLFLAVRCAVRTESSSGVGRVQLSPPPLQPHQQEELEVPTSLEDEPLSNGSAADPSSSLGINYGAILSPEDDVFRVDEMAIFAAKAIEGYEVSEQYQPTESALKALTVERWQDPEFRAWVSERDPGVEFPVALDVETAWHSLVVQECLQRYLEAEHFAIELELLSPSSVVVQALESARRTRDANAWSLMQQLGQDTSFQSWIHLWRQWERWDKEEDE